MAPERSSKEVSAAADEAGSGIDFADPNSPLAPLYLRASQVVAVSLIVGIFLFFSLLPPLFHTDFWGHLKYGEWIVQHGTLPSAEPFSAYADRSRAFVDFPWLTQVGYFALFRAGAWLAGGGEAR